MKNLKLQTTVHLNYQDLVESIPAEHVFDFITMLEIYQEDFELLDKLAIHFLDAFLNLKKEGIVGEDFRETVGEGIYKKCKEFIKAYEQS